MHPEFSRQIMADHLAGLRNEAASRRRPGRRSRRHLRNPLSRVAA